jgi:uncharacterized protein
MQPLVASIFLALILTLLSQRVKTLLRTALALRPQVIFAAPAILTAIFCAISAGVNAFSAPLAILVLAYTLLPTLCAFLARNRVPPVWTDFAIILLLWFPLEFSAGKNWTPKPAQNLLHLAAYGVAITLALILFLLFRRLDGMKYNVPRSARDFVNPLIGFAIAAPVLIVVGRAVGFLDPFHLPAHLSAVSLATQFLVILAATALPEEILFRGLIQNCLMQKLGARTGTLLLAALIFGCAHLDNGPGPLPNWRYMIVATIAGVAYGKVFEKSSSIFASALLHALVNTIKHHAF